MVSLTQNIAQGLSVKKIQSVQCNLPEQQQVCLECIAFHQREQETFNASIDMNTIRQSCTYACECNLSDINMESNVSFDFSTLLESADESEIESEQVHSTMKNAWRHMSLEGKLPLLDLDSDRTSTLLRKISTSLLDISRSDSFQSSVQDLKTTQSVVLRGVGTIHGMNIRETIHIVEDIIETNAAASTMVSDLHAEMYTIITQLIHSSSTRIIAWVVRIILYLVTAILLGGLIANVLALGKTTLLVT